MGESQVSKVVGSREKGAEVECPKCQQATRVKDSRMPDPDREWRWSVKMLQEAERVYGWWDSGGFRVRARECSDPVCAHKFFTIEIELDDLESAFADLKKESHK